MNSITVGSAGNCDLGVVPTKKPAIGRSVSFVGPWSGGRASNFLRMTEPIQPERLAGEPGDSLEQREAETVMIRLLSERLGLELRPKRITLPAGGWLQLDGHSPVPSVACEAWAHQGEAKSARKDKVTKDILKLMFVRTLLGDDTQLILLFSRRGRSQVLARR